MKLRIFVNTLMALAGTVSVATAAPITGVINLTGSVSVSNATLDFRPPEGPLVGQTVETGFGNVNPDLPATGYFADMVNDLSIPLPIIIHQLDGRDVTFLAGGAPPAPAHIDLGLTSVPNFLSNYQLFDSPAGSYTGYDYSDLFFDLTELRDPSLLGIDECDGSETTAGDTCYLGPFVVVVGTEGVGILMEIRGFFEDPNFGADSRAFYRGRYTTQLGLTTQQILNILAGGQHVDCPAVGQPGGGPGQICTSYSANFEPLGAVPEPASLLLFGAGAAAIGAHRRRKAAKARANAAV